MDFHHSEAVCFQPHRPTVDIFFKDPSASRSPWSPAARDGKTCSQALGTVFPPFAKRLDKSLVIGHFLTNMNSPLLVLSCFVLVASVSAQITVTLEGTGTLIRVPKELPGMAVGNPVSFSFDTDLAPDFPVPNGFSEMAGAASGFTFGIGPATSIFGNSSTGAMLLINSEFHEAMGFDFSGGVASNTVEGYRVVTFKLQFLNEGFVEPGTLIAPSIATTDAFELVYWTSHGGSVAFLDGENDYFSVDFEIDSLTLSGDLGMIPEPSILGGLLGSSALFFGLLRRRR
jgi:hypothetical protein